MSLSAVRIAPCLALLMAALCGAALCGCSDEDDGTGGGGGDDEGGDGQGAASQGGAGGGDGAGGAGGSPETCAGAPDVATSGLFFDGEDDHVTMGVAPELGLTELTVEAWVRRDGAGQTFGTGVGGLQLVPIAGKGRGENDGSNVDCNYAFGFYGDVLGADFEDSATGLNHPVVGQTAVTMGTWHHVAATYDGTTWRLYLDGVLDGESAANATPRGDSIQHFGIGAAFDSTGAPAGRLHGAIDEVRVWDRARTDLELQGAMFLTLDQGTGLVGRWAFDQADAAAPDSVGPNPGTIAGATFVEPGAILDLGAPPAATVASPASGAVVTGASVELSVDIAEPESAATVVTFHVREVTAADDFTIVVMPDTQYYTRPNDNHDFFYDQTQWVMDNRDDYNIVGVIHNGDIVDNGNTDSQWAVATVGMATLEETAADIPEGMPYGVCVGNHDQSPNGEANSTTKFNVHFGIDRFADKTYYGGHYSDDNDENWFTFAAGGLDFVVVNLQYDTTPDAAVLDWARGIFESHPDAFGILNTHYILGSGGNFGAQGAAIYEALKDVDNVQLMTSGHISAESRRSDEFEGNIIHSMLADYQGRADGGAGYMRIWEFSPANDELTVRSYSPTLDVWETDEDSEFTLAVDLDGSGGPFQVLSTVDPASAAATATLTGLEPGRTYEWFATVSDCVHTVDTPVASFTTAAE